MRPKRGRPVKPFLAGLPNAPAGCFRHANFFSLLLHFEDVDGDIPSRGPDNPRRLHSARRCRVSGWRGRELGPVWLVCRAFLSTPGWHLGLGGIDPLTTLNLPARAHAQLSALPWSGLAECGLFPRFFRASPRWPPALRFAPGITPMNEEKRKL